MLDKRWFRELIAALVFGVVVGLAFNLSLMGFRWLVG